MTKKFSMAPTTLILVVLLQTSWNHVEAVIWDNEICSGDDMMVTFSKCCGNEPYCSSNTKKSDCTSGEPGLYCDWIESESKEEKTTRCVPKLDERSDVCCRGGAVKDACHSIAYKMECPKDWLVNRGCCPDLSQRRYNKVLGGIPKGMDCCNSPCTQVDKAISSGNSNCTLSPRCAPGPRSYAMTYDPYKTLGFFHSYRHHGGPHSFGNIIRGSGYDYHYGYDEHEDGHEHDDGHVDEITVDDLFELMIEALEDDTDVKSYNAEYYTDAYLGKTKSGGLLADLDLPDPDYYLDMLYGNPWSLQYNLGQQFKRPTPIYSYSDNDMHQEPSPYGYKYPSYYGLHHGPSSYYDAFDPHFGAYGHIPYGGIDNALVNPYPAHQPQFNGQQYAYSPQPPSHNLAQQYGNSYPLPTHNHVNQYGNEHSLNPAQQYGNTQQSAFRNQQYHNLNANLGPNQYSVQPTRHQISSQQDPKAIIDQQINPSQKPMTDHVQYNQYTNHAAGHNFPHSKIHRIDRIVKLYR